MSKDNATIERWAYAGRRLDAKNSLRYLWYPLNAVGEVNRDVNYLFGKTPAHAIGSVYEVLVEHSEADGVTIYGKPSYTGDRIAEEKAWMRDLVLQWQTDTKAATTAKALQSQEKKNADSELKEALLPIKLAYQKTSPSQRTALLAYLIKEITHAV